MDQTKGAGGEAAGGGQALTWGGRRPSGSRGRGHGLERFALSVPDAQRGGQLGRLEDPVEERADLAQGQPAARRRGCPATWRRWSPRPGRRTTPTGGTASAETRPTASPG
jgi:hypothetical protein